MLIRCQAWKERRVEWIARIEKSASGRHHRRRLRRVLRGRGLRRADAEVTLIDRTNHHLFQPLLYQLATGILSEGDIAPPLREVLRDQRNAQVVFGEVVEIDLGTRRIVVETLDRRSELVYDSLIVATGASQSYFGHPEFATTRPA